LLIFACLPVGRDYDDNTWAGCGDPTITNQTISYLNS